MYRPDMGAAKAVSRAWTRRRSQARVRWRTRPLPPPTLDDPGVGLKQSALLEVLTEVVVLISLLSAGVKMPVPVSLARWRTPILLATVSMTMTVASVLVGMLGTRSSWPIRGMLGWFGVRGIGSLYYLMYAIQHGIAESLALELIQFTLVVVSLSILAHGTSVKPLMAMFWQHRRSLPAP
jgi:NhaP-type Na+/H+ or K+/H+ antiporter